MIDDRSLQELVKDCPVVIFTGVKGFIDPNFYYLSGAKSGIFEHSILYVSSERKVIVTSKLEEGAAKTTDCEVLVFESAAHRDEIFQKLVERDDSVGINKERLTASSMEHLKSVLGGKRMLDISARLSRARMVKNQEEIKMIREASVVAARAFERSLQKLKEGMTEASFASELIYAMMDEGSSLPPYEPTVCFGENTAFPHYSPASRKLRRGDLVLMDFQPYCGRYCADVTRTVVFGKAVERVKQMYEVVKDVQMLALKGVRSGVRGSELDATIRGRIDATEFRGLFIHGLGHGIGMEIHDHPAFSKGSETVLAPNMVVTVEPGIYLTGTGGIRIEDNVVVKEDGCINLTQIPKDLLEL